MVYIPRSKIKTVELVLTRTKDICIYKLQKHELGIKYKLWNSVDFTYELNALIFAFKTGIA